MKRRCCLLGSFRKRQIANLLFFERFKKMSVYKSSSTNPTLRFKSSHLLRLMAERQNKSAKNSCVVSCQSLLTNCSKSDAFTLTLSHFDGYSTVFLLNCQRDLWNSAAAACACAVKKVILAITNITDSPFHLIGLNFKQTLHKYSNFSPCNATATF